MTQTNKYQTTTQNNQILDSLGIHTKKPIISTSPKVEKFKYAISAFAAGRFFSRRNNYGDKPELKSSDNVFNLEDTYTERGTCIPNCDRDKGGPPIFTVSLIISYLIVHGTFSQEFLVKKVIGDQDQILEQEPTSYLNNTLAFLPHQNNQFWRYITYQFCHVNLNHLWMNLSLLIVLGPILEYIHGTIRIFIIYNVGVIVGAMMSYLVDNYKICVDSTANSNGSNTNEQTIIQILIGCSGGVYSLIFVHLANIIINQDSMRTKNFLINILVNTPILGLAIYEFYLGISRSRFLENELYAQNRSVVSWSAHLGGAITGLSFGMYFLINHETKLWEKKVEIWFLGLFCGIVLVLFVLQFMHEIN